MNIKTLKVRNGYRVDMTQGDKHVSCYGITKQDAWRLALHKIWAGIKQ